MGTVTATAVRRPTAGSARGQRDFVGATILGIVGLLIVAFLAHPTTAGQTSRIRLSAGNAFVSLPTIDVPSRATCYVLGIVCVLLGVSQVLWLSRRGRAWTLAGGACCLGAALLVSADAGNSFNAVALMQVALEGSTTLLLGALGGLLGERAGVINVAIEGEMLAGAFVGAVVGAAVGRWGGVAAATAVGGLTGFLLTVFAIRYRVDQIIVGIVINIFVLGITDFLYDAVLSNKSGNYVKPFGVLSIPVLRDIPLIGPVLFEQRFYAYVALILVVVISLALSRTTWGLRVRAVGENPYAADAVGINVVRMRYVNVVLGGCLAGFAGAYLSLGLIGSFQKNMTNGLGFVALAVMIVGRWRPVGVLVAAIIFGLAQGLEQQLSTLGSSIPSAFLLMVPYVVTIIVVGGWVGRSRAPAADGQVFIKG
jgi:general nucleoside transport system permease protein